tara:strand:+ start:777 stop:1130 length:354 start_codon:yes stop_codon:yes gene_type:complete
MQTYVDVRIVAGLVKYFQKMEVPHKSSYSHVLNEILRAVHSDWVGDTGEYFPTTEVALQYLSEQGFSVSQMGTPGRGDKILRAMNKDALKEVSETEEAPTVNSGRAAEIVQLFDQEE